MISILNLTNDNIQSLTGVLEAKGVLEEDEGKDRGTTRIAEDGATEIIKNQAAEKTHEQKVEETHEALEVAQIM